MKTFTTACLKAISHLSKTTQDHIIADITRYRLTGEMPEKMSPMRRAVFNSLILLLDSETTDDIKDIKDSNDLNVLKDLKAPKAHAAPPSPAPNYIAIDQSGRVTPLYIPDSAGLPPDRPVQAFPS